MFTSIIGEPQSRLGNIKLGYVGDKFRYVPQSFSFKSLNQYTQVSRKNKKKALWTIGLQQNFSFNELYLNYLNHTYTLRQVQSLAFNSLLDFDQLSDISDNYKESYDLLSLSETIYPLHPLNFDDDDPDPGVVHCALCAAGQIGPTDARLDWDQYPPGLYPAAD